MADLRACTFPISHLDREPDGNTVYGRKLDVLFRTVTRAMAGRLDQRVSDDAATPPTGTERRQQRRRTPFFTNAEVARLAGGGIQPQSIGNIKSGRFTPSPDTLYRVATVFGVDPAFWWAENDDVEPFLLSLRVSDGEVDEDLSAESSASAAVHVAMQRAVQLRADLVRARLRAGDQQTADELESAAQRVADEYRLLVQLAKRASASGD